MQSGWKSVITYNIKKIRKFPGKELLEPVDPDLLTTWRPPTSSWTRPAGQLHPKPRIAIDIVLKTLHTIIYH